MRAAAHGPGDDMGVGDQLRSHKQTEQLYTRYSYLLVPPMPAFGVLDALVLPAFRLVLLLRALIGRLRLRGKEMRRLAGGVHAGAGACHCGWWQSTLHCCVGNVQ